MCVCVHECVHWVLYVHNCWSVTFTVYFNYVLCVFFLIAQNQWMRENLFDVHGNYLYCMKCIVHSLGVHTQRLARQRQIKIRLCQEPVATITKEEVVAKNLKKFILHPGVDESTMVVSAWWKTLSNDSEVEVKLPHERHGLAGKASNKSKPAVRDAFLKFVDANSHPNGRQAGSYNPQFYFTSQFTRIDPPKEGEKDFETKAKSSIVWVFNRAQTEAGGGTCLAFAARQWLKDNRPKVALHPHKSDYCNTCKYHKEEISRQNAILKRLSQSGSAQEEELKDAPLCHHPYFVECCVVLTL